MEMNRPGNAAIALLAGIVLLLFLLAGVTAIAMSIWSGGEPANSPAAVTAPMPSGWQCDENGCHPVSVTIPGESASQPQSAPDGWTRNGMYGRGMNDMLNGIPPYVRVPHESASPRAYLTGYGTNVGVAPYRATDGVELSPGTMLLGPMSDGAPNSVAPSVAPVSPSRTIPHADLAGQPADKAVRMVPHMTPQSMPVCTGPNCGKSSSSAASTPSHRRFRVFGRRR